MAEQKKSKIFEDNYRGIAYNIIFAILVLFLGILGQLIVRFLKKSWRAMWWGYIPIFWPPVVLSWPVSIGILMGKMD